MERRGVAETFCAEKRRGPEGKRFRKGQREWAEKVASGRSRRVGLRRCGAFRAFINFLPLSPGGICVFMRHTEAYKRRAISDTIKMCISRALF